MTTARVLVFLGSAFFILYGFAFTVLPVELAVFVTGEAPSTSSGLIDMRSTYGGMSVAVGIVLALLAIRDDTVRTSVVGLLIVMLCMAATRVVGIAIEGQPNTIMYIYLLLEALTAALCCSWLYFVDAGDA